MLGGRSIHDVFDSAEEYMIGYVIICIMTVSMEYSHLHVWLSQRSWRVCSLTVPWLPYPAQTFDTSCAHSPPTLCLRPHPIKWQTQRVRGLDVCIIYDLKGIGICYLCYETRVYMSDRRRRGHELPAMADVATLPSSLWNPLINTSLLATSCLKWARIEGVRI